jgi:hypothetical protein
MTTKPTYLLLPKPLASPSVTEEIETKGSIVLIGANGSGKTRLGSWIEIYSAQKLLVHRISAQKSLSFPPTTTTSSSDKAIAKLYYGFDYGTPSDYANVSNKVGNRWQSDPNTFLLNDFGFLLEYLFTDEFEISTKYRQAAKNTDERIPPPESKLDITKRIWEEVLPHRELIIGGGKIETRIKGSSASTYNASKMSDGERVIFYLIGQSLSAPAGGILVVDEPELHLHESIQSILWDKIEAERPDCLFVYLTHNLEFAASRTTATKICLRAYDGETWDWYEVPKETNIPEEMLLEIIGSRKPIIFTEGDRGSLDFFVYQKVYPKFTIVPSGGCEIVIHATRSFSTLNSLHRLTCNGIIDQDFRDSAEVAYLQGIGIHVLGYSELENVFLTEEVLDYVATKLLKDDFPVLFDKVKAVIFGEMDRNKERLISSITVAKVEKKLKDFDASATGEINLIAAFNNLISPIDVSAIYQSTKDEVEHILSSRNYTEAIKIYSNKGLLAQVASIFGFKTNELMDYIQRLLSNKEGEALITIISSKLPIITP